MPNLPVFQNKEAVDPSPLFQAGKGAEKRGYYTSSMIQSGLGDIAQGVRRVQSQYEQSQKVDDKLAAAQDVGNATQGVAKATAELAVQWKQTLAGADPNDPNVAQKFIDDVATPRLDQIADGLQTDKGKAYFAKARATAWASLYKSTMADNANLAAKNAISQVHDVANSYSQAAYYDPTNWKSHLDQAEGAIGAYQDAHNLRATDAIGLKDQVHSLIVKSAVDGMIAQNPQAAKDALAKGDFSSYLTGEDVSKFSNKADQMIRAGEHDKVAAEKADVTQKRQDGTKALNDLEGQITVDPDTGAKVVPKDYFKTLSDVRTKYGDVIPDGTFRSAENWASTELRRNAKTVEHNSDTTTYSDFSRKAADGSLTRAEVYQARASGYLSNKDFSFFRGWVKDGGAQGPATGDRQELKDVSGFVRSMKGYIDSSLGGQFTDTWGKSRFTEFQSDMMHQWQEGKAKGMTPEQFQDYVKKSIPSYTFNQDQVTQELRRQGEKGDMTVQPPPEVTPPGFDKAGPAVKVDDFFKQGAADIKNQYTPAPVADTGANIPTLAVPADGLGIKTGTQPGRQPLDLSHMNPVVMSKWERVQGILGYQVPVVSGYRDAARNARAGGAQGSEHLHGNAIDLDVSHMNTQERVRLIDTASALGFTGIGVYDNSIHLDVGSRRAWGPTHHSDSVPGWAAAAIKGHLANQYGANAETDFTPGSN